MDNLRGNFDSASFGDDERDFDYGDDDAGHEPPPAAIGTDERRMQVRAYNHWASQLDDRAFPSIEDLDPDALPDFGPFSVLLDFTAGMDNPAIQFLGSELGEECGAHSQIEMLDDIPSRSLLSRITDHYMQILANQAPIGFEAEFINQRDVTILYRGILLPYSSDGETIDFIYGVINWKEMADQITSDELLLEIDQALESDASQEPIQDAMIEPVGEPVTDWADGPASEGPEPSEPVFCEPASDYDHAGDNYISEFDGLDSAALADDDNTMDDDPVVSRMASLIQPRKSTVSALFDTKDEFGTEDADEDEDENDHPDLDFSTLSSGFATAELEDRFEKPEPQRSADAEHGPSAHIAQGPGDNDIEDTADGQSSLHDCLADARELAHAASASEDRTRATLYAAVSRAYDVSLAAQNAPEDFDELMRDNGLTVQDRAPMTPIVKLVFGSDYDKTRLTEYASVLSHAQRAGIEQGGLKDFLSNAEGGLKGVVSAERRIRKEESGKTVEPTDRPRASIARKLRALDGQPLDTLDPQGAEFGLVMIRRLTTGEIVILGEVSDDIPLVEKAARKLI
ncbi:PAS domain-containing protein [Pontixanthobacter sp.]|uniref:PAS domain-containing protein n=1 Tax=Pontixanthobacter sp. TaxID=2792078 RepID=UPI003C7AF9E2